MVVVGGEGVTGVGGEGVTGVGGEGVTGIPSVLSCARSRPTLQSGEWSRSGEESGEGSGEESGKGSGKGRETGRNKIQRVLWYELFAARATWQTGCASEP